jgi:hypothetical protein
MEVVVTTQELDRLRDLLPDRLILQLSSEFPSLRIPAKTLRMRIKQEAFFTRIKDCSDLRQLSRELCVPLSTIYTWLHKARKTRSASTSSDSADSVAEPSGGMHRIRSPSFAGNRRPNKLRQLVTQNSKKTNNNIEIQNYEKRKIS